MPTTVADVLVDGLLRAGTPRLFGVPGGGSSLDLIAAARRHGLGFVLTHGETAACLMAAVTGDLLGVPGAAATALGPGVTSAANGIAHAFLDRSPMVVLTDRHPAGALTFTSHQRLDHAALLGPITKASLTVEPASAGHWIAHAANLAMAEPRGPVHIDVAADIAAETAVPVATSCRPSPLPPPSSRDLDEAGRLLAAASRPVLLAGLRAADADVAKWLRALAESLPAPVLVTYKAKGALPDPHPLALGLLTGGVIEEDLLHRADLLVAIGLDTVELIPRRFTPAAPVLSLGRSAADRAYYRPVAEVIGDIALVIEELAPRLRARARADWDVAELDRRKRALASRLAVPSRGRAPDGRTLAPHRVVQIVREATPAGTIATVDAGAHMFPVTSFWQAVGPGEFLVSNGLATMGFALPAAIAAQLARPDRRVVCFTGDGGLAVALGELETAARLALPIVVVVFDDETLSLIQVKQEQRGLGDTRLGYRGPDLVPLARSFGFAAFAADTEAALATAVERALGAGGPALIDARIDASGYAEVLEVVRGGAGRPAAAPGTV